ncbi:C40 family peptidase [Kineosporia succinea]|uniref:Cell wall-associated NlpC family hydrolase n=1 Tax=Kineosporia succinea TaxID=84632 RepID=A0ABT9P4Q1_9ACTN|nr:C40 family peptidase [Kineosporia succinea]MDP9827030.1 cell wall-associated NlpC family hydrolase [Kineosporia succinea]
MRDTAAALALASALIGGTALSAAADEPIPGQDDVRRAQQHTDEVQSRVDAIQAQLKASAQRVEAANVALSEAAENYDYAQVKLQEAGKAADAAQAVAADANTKLDGAQEDVGRLAAQTYRSGGQLADLNVLLSPQGTDEVLEHASMMQVLAGQQQRTVRRADSARVVANSLTAQAAQALERRQAAADELEKTKEAAQQKAAAAQAALADDTKQKNALLTELAAARRTSVQVERQREEGLRRQADERREAAARAAREAAREAADRESAAAKDDNDGGGSSSGGSTSSGGSGNSGGSGSGGSASSGGSGGSRSSGSSSAGGSAVSWAKGKLGLPYLWGGEGPGSYDCSGLVMKAWAQAGVSLPHSSRLQYQSVQHISYDSMRPGDLIFFGTNTSNPSSIHHVAMYIGGGQMIEAPYTGAFVRIVPVRTSEAMPYAGRP